MAGNIPQMARLMKKVVLHFTDCAIPYARENYDPALIEEQKDGSLLVTINDAVDSKIVNLVLNEGGAVQVVSPMELAEKVVEQAERVIKAHRPNKPYKPNRRGAFCLSCLSCLLAFITRSACSTTFSASSGGLTT